MIARSHSCEVGSRRRRHRPHARVARRHERDGEVVVWAKRIAQGRSRRGGRLDLHVMLTDHGRLPVSREPPIGYVDAAEVHAGFSPGRRYRVRSATGPWSAGRGVIEVDP